MLIFKIVRVQFLPSFTIWVSENGLEEPDCEVLLADSPTDNVRDYVAYDVDFEYSGIHCRGRLLKITEGMTFMEGYCTHMIHDIVPLKI